MALAVAIPHSELHPERLLPQRKALIRSLKASGSRAQEECVSKKRHGAQVWDVDVRELENKFRERRYNEREERRRVRRVENGSREAASQMLASSQPKPKPSIPNEMIDKGQVFIIDRNGEIGLYWDKPRRPRRLPPPSAFVDFSAHIQHAGPSKPPQLYKFGAPVRQVALRKEWAGSKKARHPRSTTRDEDPDGDHAAVGALEVMTLPILLFPPHIPGVMARRALLLSRLDRRHFDNYADRGPSRLGPSSLRMQL